MHHLNVVLLRLLDTDKAGREKEGSNGKITLRPASTADGLLGVWKTWRLKERAGVGNVCEFWHV